MNVLLDDVIAAEPVEHVPVSDLILHLRGGAAQLLRQLGPPRLRPDRTAVPVHAHRQDIADGPVMQSFHGLEIVGLMTPLQADADLEVFLLCFLGRGEDPAHAGAVDGDGLLHENVLALPDRFLEVNRPEAGGGGEDHQVSRGNGLLVSVQPHELVGLGHIDRRTVLLLQVPIARVELVFEGVRHGHQLDAFLAGVERLIGRAGTASAAADQRHSDGIPGRGAKGKPFHRQGAQERAARHGAGSGLQETPASNRPFDELRAGHLGLRVLGIFHGRSMRLKLKLSQCNARAPIALLAGSEAGSSGPGRLERFPAACPRRNSSGVADRPQSRYLPATQQPVN